MTAMCFSVKRRETLKEFEVFTDTEHMQLPDRSPPTRRCSCPSGSALRTPRRSGSPQGV